MIKSNFEEQILWFLGYYSTNMALKLKRNLTEVLARKINLAIG